QKRMDKLDRWQRDLYPVVGNRPRSVAYPALKHSGRKYRLAREAAVWDIRKVWDLLGSHVVPRQASGRGSVSLYNRHITVGLMWAGRKILVGFDPEEGAWTFHDSRGHEIRRQPAKELSRRNILEMNVTYRRRGIHAARRDVRTGAAHTHVRS